MMNTNTYEDQVTKLYHFLNILRDLIYKEPRNINIQNMLNSSHINKSEKIYRELISLEIIREDGRKSIDNKIFWLWSNKFDVTKNLAEQILKNSCEMKENTEEEQIDIKEETLFRKRSYLTLKEKEKRLLSFLEYLYKKIKSKEHFPPISILLWEQKMFDSVLVAKILYTEKIIIRKGRGRGLIHSWNDDYQPNIELVKKILDLLDLKKKKEKNKLKPNKSKIMETPKKDEQITQKEEVKFSKEKEEIELIKKEASKLEEERDFLMEKAKHYNTVINDLEWESDLHQIRSNMFLIPVKNNNRVLITLPIDLIQEDFDIICEFIQLMKKSYK